MKGLTEMTIEGEGAQEVGILEEQSSMGVVGAIHVQQMQKPEIYVHLLCTKKNKRSLA